MCSFDHSLDDLAFFHLQRFTHLYLLFLQIRTFGVDDLAFIHAGLIKKYYCLAAVCALLRYLEQVENVTFSPKTLRFRFCVLEDAMMIDAVTAKNLELTVNILNPMKGPSLFSVLNHTMTPMGTRLLRMVNSSWTGQTTA